MRTVKKVLALSKKQLSPFFNAYSFRGDKEVSPFLNLDHFHMSQPTFPPHPHAGFSAVTYLFEDSPGSFKNRDSFGNDSIIRPGGLQWTQAGSGIVHEEVPLERGIDCHGLQMFVNLSENHELATGKAFHIEADEVPEIVNEHRKIRILAGKYQDIESPLTDLLTKISFFDIHLQEGIDLDLVAPKKQTLLIMVIDGQILINDHVSVNAHNVALFHEDSDLLKISGGSGGGQLLFLSGEKMQDDIIWFGPFCLSSEERLMDAKYRYSNGEMGRLDPYFGEK